MNEINLDPQNAKEAMQNMPLKPYHQHEDIEAHADLKGEEAKRLAELTNQVASGKKFPPVDLLNFYHQTNEDKFKLDVISLIMSLTDKDIGLIGYGLLEILRGELTGSEVSVNMYFISALINRLAEAIRSANTTLVDKFGKFIKDFQEHSNPTIRLALQEANSILLTASHQPTESQYSGDYAKAQAYLQTFVQPKADISQVLKAEQFSVQNMGTYQRYISPDESIKFRVSNEGREISVDILSDRVWAQLVGGIKMGLFGGIIQVGDIPPMILLAPIVEYLLFRLSKLQDKKNLYKFAVVSESVACIYKKHTSKNVRLVKPGKEMSVQSFVRVYQDLLDEGYQRIISLHMSSKLSRAYVYAKKAAEQVTDAEVMVINSHANGLGLRLMIQEIEDAIINHYSPTDIYHLIQNLKQRLAYWIVSEDFNYLRNKNWLDKISDKNVKMKLRYLKHKPLIYLKENIQLVDTFPKSEAAITNMLGLIDDAYQRNHKRLKRIGIEYCHSYRMALDLQNKLRVKYRNIPITIHTAGSVTTSYFGPDLIGVCII